MDNGMTTADLLRLIGLMSVFVGIAWAIQILGFPVGSTASRLMWVMAAGSVSGAGVGLVLTAGSLADDSEAVALKV